MGRSPGLIWSNFGAKLSSGVLLGDPSHLGPLGLSGVIWSQSVAIIWSYLVRSHLASSEAIRGHLKHLKHRSQICALQLYYKRSSRSMLRKVFFLSLELEHVCQKLKIKVLVIYTKMGRSSGLIWSKFGAKLSSGAFLCDPSHLAPSGLSGAI